MPAETRRCAVDPLGPATVTAAALVTSAAVIVACLAGGRDLVQTLALGLLALGALPFVLIVAGALFELAVSLVLALPGLLTGAFDLVIDNPIADALTQGGRRMGALYRRFLARQPSLLGSGIGLLAATLAMTAAA